MKIHPSCIVKYKKWWLGYMWHVIDSVAIMLVYAVHTTPHWSILWPIMWLPINQFMIKFMSLVISYIQYYYQHASQQQKIHPPWSPCIDIGVGRCWRLGGPNMQLCAKFLRPCPLYDKPRPFWHDRDCYREFLGEKMNRKSNWIDLEAIEAHSLILATAD